MRLELTRPWVRFPAGLRCVFSSDPAVGSSIFVEAEREENLIRNDPDKSEFAIMAFVCLLVDCTGAVSTLYSFLNHGHDWCACLPVSGCV